MSDEDDAPCKACDGEGTLLCGNCNGSGEGLHEFTRCTTCKGSGAVPCGCVEDDDDNR